MILVLPQNRALNLAHVAHAQYELVEQPAQPGKPIASTSKLELAMSDGQTVTVAGPVAKGIWGVIVSTLAMGIVNEDGTVGIKQMGKAQDQIVRAAAIPKVAMG